MSQISGQNQDNFQKLPNSGQIPEFRDQKQHCVERDETSDRDDNSDGDRRTPCPKCQEKFVSVVLLKEHLKIVHNVQERPKRGPKKDFLKAPLGQGSLCPVDNCRKEFSKAANVRKHMLVVHKLTPAQIAGFSFKQTRKLCPHCQKAISNMAKHKKHCKPLNNPPVAVQDEPEVNHRIPLDLERGGSQVIRDYVCYLDTQANLAAGTKRLYIGSLKRMINFWEEHMEGIL